MESGTIRIGISSCLLGERVRYDGQHKLDRFLTETLGKYVEWVPVCPEVECGLPIPRPAMRLVGSTDAPRLMTRDTGMDLTDMMLGWIPGRLSALAGEDLCGFIFKAKSPSSGMERVKVYSDSGGLAGSSSGLFAGAFMRHFPLLPVEDEGRLHDPDLRENFIERVFTLHRYRSEARSAECAATLVGFHARNKLLLMSHSPALCREMGRLVARSGKRGALTYRAYETLLLRALSLLATVNKHVNVLDHAMGYFKKLITTAEKRELLDLISSFKRREIPLIVPVTLLRHHIARHHVSYLADQTYFNPHPSELKLRNHA